jgi:hypothetical protein
MSCGRENIILGLPWLKETNPTIDWARQTLNIPETVDQSKELYSMHTADVERHNSVFRKTPRHPHHVNVDSITDERLFDYLDYETEEKYIYHARRNRAINRSSEGTLISFWDPR